MSGGFKDIVKNGWHPEKSGGIRGSVVRYAVELHSKYIVIDRRLGADALARS